MPVASSATRQSLGGPSKSNSRAYPEACSAFPVPEKLNFHVLVQLVDRHNPKAQAGGLERRLVAYANWNHCNVAPHRGIAGEYFMLWRSQPDTRQLHGVGVSFHLIPHLGRSQVPGYFSSMISRTTLQLVREATAFR